MNPDTLATLGSRLPSARQGRWAAVALGVVGLAVIAARLWGPGAAGEVRLRVYAFSTQEECLGQGIFPAFRRSWLAEHGEAVTLDGVFGASGTLAGEINLGAPADVAILSHAGHVTWLQIGRRVRRDAAVVAFAQTPIVVVVRAGNPLAVEELGDLARPGLRLLHADPRASGAGAWAVLAEYGQSLFRRDGNETAAAEELAAIWDNVRYLAPSARAAMTLFELGAGDALVTYEQDARLARARGAAIEVVVPPRTIIAQHVAVVVDANVTRRERAAAEGLVTFLASPAAHPVLQRFGLRPLAGAGADFAPLEAPFTIDALGGWAKASATVIDELWGERIAPGLDLAPALSGDDPLAGD